MTRRTRLTLKRVRQIGWRHNAQEDHGTTLGPGARESYPSKRSAAGNPRLRFLATWAGLGEPTAAADTHPAHLDHRRHRGKPDRHRRRRPVGDGRHPEPSIFDDAPGWVTFIVMPGYLIIAIAVGSYWITRRTVEALRWAIEERKPTRIDERNTFLAPWRVAAVDLSLWGIGTVLSTTLYGLFNGQFIPRFLFGVGICGVLVATGAYLITEFALRPVAAQALEAGRPPRRLTSGL